MPLYARLSNSEQNRCSSRQRTAHCAGDQRRGNLATVPGIKYVIDPGTARISRYSYRTKVQRLPIEPISQASANQRKGRCGRVSEGTRIRLIPKTISFAPGVHRSGDSAYQPGLRYLQMTALGLGDTAAFPFVEAPDKRNIQDGVRLLEELARSPRMNRPAPIN
ncbi:hypothetical protein ACNKHL_10690 [Shigella flexneri]